MKMITAVVFATLIWPGLCTEAFPQDIQVHTANKVELIKGTKPAYPPLGRAARITGPVSVAVTVNPDGKVESVSLESGHPLLSQAALDSARQSQFECHLCSQPVQSRMLYRFELRDTGNCCSVSTTPPATADSELKASGPTPPENEIVVIADPLCICDPAFTLGRKVRSPKCLYLWRCAIRQE